MSDPNNPSTTTLYAGFDTFSLAVPDFDNIFPSLIQNFQNIKWCGFYLGRTDAKNMFTRDNHDKLVGWGYNIAPIFFGKQLREVPETVDPVALGTSAGTSAVHQALAVNIPTRSYIYFDVEPGWPNEPWLKQFAAWSQAVVLGQYRPAAYIRWEIVDWLYNGLASLQKKQGYSAFVAAPRIWVVNYATKDPTRPSNAGLPPKRPRRATVPADWIGPDPAEAHTIAEMYQWNPGQSFHWTDSNTGKVFDLFPVDLCTSTDPDPGVAGS